MLKTLAAQIKEFKRDSILTPVFMILEVLMETLIPFLMASIIDNGVNKGDIHHIYVVGAWMVVAACFSLFAGIMGGKYGARASTGFARNLRKSMFENIQTFSFSNIDKFSTPSLVTQHCRSCYPYDYRRHQPAECLPDDPPHVYESTGQSDLCHGNVLLYQSEACQRLSDCRYPLRWCACYHHPVCYQIF